MARIDAGTKAGSGNETATRTTPTTERLSSLARLWMRLADFLETTGGPFLLSILFTMVSISLCQVRALQEWYKSVFVGEIPNWATFAAVSFAFFLSVFLILKRRAAKSLRHLKKCARAFRRLEKERLINATQRTRAMEFAIVLFAMRNMGSSPQEALECEKLLSDPSIRKILDSMEELKPSSTEQVFDKLWEEQVRE